MNENFKIMQEIMEKGNDEEFEFFISTHQDLLKEDPVLFISNHVSYYASSERVDKVLEVINYYKNAPYISMTVEDLLNELKTEVERLAKPSKSITKESVIKDLLSKNEEKISYAINVLSNSNIRSYQKEIQEFLLQDIPYKYKTLILFILIEQKYEKEVKVSKNGLIYTLAPTLLELPFDTYDYQEEVRLIEEENIDPQVKKTAIEILNICQIKEFPDSYISLDSLELMKDVFIFLANSYLLNEVSLDAVCLKHQITKEKCQEIVNELNKIINE